MVDGLFLWAMQSPPYFKGRAPSVTKFLGTPLTPVRFEATTCSMITQLRKDGFLCVTHAPYPKGTYGVPAPKGTGYRLLRVRGTGS